MITFSDCMQKNVIILNQILDNADISIFLYPRDLTPKNNELLAMCAPICVCFAVKAVFILQIKGIALKRNPSQS